MSNGGFQRPGCVSTGSSSWVWQLVKPEPHLHPPDRAAWTQGEHGEAGEKGKKEKSICAKFSVVNSLYCSFLSSLSGE